MASIKIVGGTWDASGGKPSKIVEDLARGVSTSNSFSHVVVSNGGNYYSLARGFELPPCSAADVVLWIPNIPNYLPKLKSVKEIFPKVILVSSKNNVFTKYSFQDIVAHGLALKSNLVLEIRQFDSLFTGRLIDTLGNMWHNTTVNFEDLGSAIAKCSRKLVNIKRQATIRSPEEVDPIITSCNGRDITEFFKIVKDTAELFHELIRPPKGITRFLGNASFRCERGFPSIRLNDGRIYMSRRNVDKRFIGPGAFVQVGFNEDTGVVWYRGDHKPSVDTVVQVRLYKELSNINYMIHSHVYEKYGPHTSKMIPCGGLEEVDEVLKVVSDSDLRDRAYFAINLKGHGSIVFMNELSDFRRFEFKARPTPEIM